MVKEDKKSLLAAAAKNIPLHGFLFGICLFFYFGKICMML